MAPAPPGPDPKPYKKPKVSAKKLLMDWVNASIPDHRVKNFHTSWNNGVSLSALVDYCKPGLIPDHASLNPDDRLKNVSHAMDLAANELGVPKVLSPEDLAVDKPDENSMMTYISGFCGPNSAGQNSLLDWVNSKIPNHPVSNFTTDWSDGTALAALVDSLSEGNFPEADLMKEEDKFNNCKEAMDAAKDLLGIKNTCRPEDFSENSMDQLIRATYITEFRHIKPPAGESLASQIKAVGPGITGDSVQKETSFVVRGPRIPKWAKVNATVNGPDNSELPVKSQNTSSKATQFHYTPEEPGEYVVEVDLNSEPIPGSPFHLTHVPPTNVDGCIATGSGLKKAKVGETAGFSVNCEKGGPGELQVDIETPSGGLENEIEEQPKDNYNVNYTPKEIGDHVISVLWDNKNIPSSPFMCAVTDPKQCTVSGSGLSKAFVGQPQTFTVKTNKAGQEELVIEVDGPDGPVDVKAKEMSKDVFNVTYIPKAVGPHKISVRYGDGTIPGSPFKVDVVAPADASKCTISNLPEGKLRVGNTYSVDVDATQAGSGEMTALAQGPSVPESCSVKDCGGDLYAVNFTPAEVGPLKVDISYGEDKLSQCPLEFTCNDPTKVKVDSNAVKSESYHISQPIQFEVSAARAGEGDLMASVLTAAGEKPAELKHQGGQSYLFNYSPSEGGSHAINIKFDGTDIPDVPIRIFVDDSSLADKIVVIQPLANKMGIFLQGTPHTYKVMVAGAGQADLRITSVGANTGIKPSIDLIYDGNEQYSVGINANEPDDYTMNITWGEEHVPGSPFMLPVEGKPQPENVVCVGPVYTIGSCKDVTLEANAEKAGAGMLTASCHGDEVGKVPVDVIKNRPKIYTVSFTPPKTDIYSLNVMWHSSDVKDSPFKINLIPPNASKCIVEGPIVPVDSTEPIIVYVDASKAGNGTIAASALGDKTGEKNVMIDETKPNVFVLSFVPVPTDFYTMDVKWGDSSVPGAPFRVNSSAANADKVVICEPPTAMLQAGQAIGICFDTSEGGNGTLTATCKGENIGKVPITVSQRKADPDKFDVHFLPPEPDVYVINVFWSGVDAKGSPFTINLMPVNVSKIKVIGPSMPRGSEGPVELKLLTAGAGKGKVTGTCNGDAVGPVEVVIKETKIDTFDLCFIPPKPDAYSLSVQYGGQKLKQSPFLINTLPSNANLVKVDEPVSIDLSKDVLYNVDTTKAGTGNLTTTCRGKKQGPVKVTTTSEIPGYYDVSFSPRADYYKVTMEWDDKEVPGSPFSVDLRPPMADRVKVGELHVPDKIGSNNYVWLDLDCTDAGHGPLKAEAEGKKVGKVPAEADQLSVSKYRMKFLPKKEDMYTFAVAYGDEQVTGSPFKINLMSPDANEVKHTRTDLPKSVDGPVTMFFDTTNAGRGKMIATVQNDLSSEVANTVEPVSFTEHKVSFVSNAPDLYHVNVNWSGEKVAGSPFIVDTRPPLNPGLVDVGEPIFTGIGDPVSLYLNTYKAGPGLVTAECTSAGEPVPVEVTKPTTPSDDYKVSFIPEDPGNYDLSVFFDGGNVKGSPFPVNLNPVSEIFEKVERQSVEETYNIPKGLKFDKESRPVEDKVSSVPTLEIGAPLSVVVSMDDDDTTEDTVIAAASGEHTGPCDVEVTKNGDNSFTVNFDPTIPDLYTIDVAHNGKPLEESPFMVNYVLPVDASKCRIFGLEDIPPVPLVNETISFGVDAKEAGNGNLSVTTGGPPDEVHPSDLDVRPDKGEEGIYYISYTATAVGKHNISLLWSEDKIPGSPLSFDITDTRKLQRFPYGMPVAMNIDPNTKAGNLDGHAIHEDSGTKYKVKFNKQKDGKHKVAFQPKEPGIYAVHVLQKKTPIRGSPFRIRYLGPPNPNGVVINDFSGEGCVNCPYNFTIDAEEAGTGEPAVRVVGPETVNDSDIACTPCEDSERICYDVSFTPRNPGVHEFLITWAGMPILSGPFKADIVDGKPECKTVLQGEIPNLVEVGTPANVIFLSTLPSFNPDSLSADFEGDKTGNTSGDIKIVNDKNCVVQFTPIDEDDYSLNVKYNDSHIKGSPFTIKAVKKDALSLDYAHPDQPQHGDIEVGKPVNVVRQGPAPEVAPPVSITGPFGSCPCTVTTDGDRGIGVEFLPPYSGDYIIKSVDTEGTTILDPCKITASKKASDPSKVKVLDDDIGIFNKPLPLGKPACFHISTVDAGPGTLNMNSKGPGKASIKVFDNNNGIYTCDFTPSVAGNYQVDILWNNEHIHGSPFMLHFKAEEKIIGGLNLENQSFIIDVPHRFKLNCASIGKGILEISCKPPSAAEIRLSSPSEGSGLYQCMVVPKKVGNHELRVQYDGKHILGSPFNVQFDDHGDASKCVLLESFVTNQNTDQEKINFIVLTEGAGSGVLTSVLEQTSSNTPLPVTVTTLPDKKYRVEFSPKEDEEYVLHIKFDNQHIPGSPFKLAFGGDSADAAQCTVEGDGIQACLIGIEANFIVNTPKPNQGGLVIAIDGEDKVLTPKMKGLGDTKTEVSYIADKTGKYYVNVKWGQENVPGSPFLVECFNPSDASRFSITNPPSNSFLGSLLKYTVKSVYGRPLDGSLAVSAQSSTNKFIQGRVEEAEEDDSSYRCTLDIQNTGKFLIHTRWNGAHIKNSPFRLKVILPPIPENVKCYGPGLENGFVGQEGNFTIETEEAGSGTLAVKLYGPKGSFKINMRCHPENKRTILVRYDPKHVGEYKVYIMWSDINVPGSPFEVEFTEQ